MCLLLKHIARSVQQYVAIFWMSFSVFCCFAVPIKFIQLSQDIQMPPGGPLTIRCTTASEVEECKWTWQSLDESNSTEIVVKQFLALGNYSQDCSLHFDTVLTEHEGNWTCAARNPAETHFTSAPPARLTLLQPGINSVNHRNSKGPT